MDKQNIITLDQFLEFIHDWAQRTISETFGEFLLMESFQPFKLADPNGLFLTSLRIIKHRDIPATYVGMITAIEFQNNSLVIDLCDQNGFINLKIPVEKLLVLYHYDQPNNGTCFRIQKRKLEKIEKKELTKTERKDDLPRRSAKKLVKA